MKIKRLYKIICVAMILVCALPMNVFASKLVNVGSGAARTDSFITINKALSDKSQGLSLIMCGLSKDNASSMINAVSGSYDPTQMESIKYVDTSFVDAEKYDVAPDPLTDPPYDSNLCWAGSISNMMWMAGWAKGITNPYNSKEFLSEDDVFSFMNSRFIDGGSDTLSGIEFYFTGMYYVAFNGFGHAGRCMVGDRTQYGAQDVRDGLYKNLITSKLTEGVNLIGTADHIKALETICTGTGDDMVFQVSVGDLDASASSHSVTGIGLVVDPSATDYSSRYKAIILANTDNDGEPTPEEKAVITTDAQREASKAARPNSYTLYPLRLTAKDTGEECWELVDYSEDETTILYNLTGLKYKTASNITAATETDGSKDSINNVDLQIGYASLSIEPNEIDRDVIIDRNNPAKLVDQSQPLYLNFHVQNHSEKDLDSTYTSAKTISLEYSIIRDRDSKIVYQDTCEVSLPLSGNSQLYSNVNLNQSGVLNKLEGGEYTVRIEINPSRTIKEAYYDNNTVDYCRFKIESHGANTADDNHLGVYCVLMLLAISLVPTLQGRLRQQH